uniref:NADH-ubiquinone oxidoreductase chain 2 n=1 Tax=Arion vulgaris TaxID=1028688 RepID=A0A6C0AAL7_9EUPU|nr:NADH dehydrogenase subunit 2 [Arion vulgaris]QHS71059.1 NADH dehydrogenase subunit 2 [Arion vulgaris]
MSLLKMVFVSSLLFAPLLSIISSNWWLIWLSLEIMTFSMVVCIFFSNSLMKAEVSMIYFVVQSISGVLLLVGGTYTSLITTNQMMCSFFLVVGLATKLGLFPMHFWVIPMLSMLSYWQIGVLLGPMKIIPLNMLYTVSADSTLWFMMMSMSLLSMLCGGILGNIMANFKGVLGASSITHSGWFVLAFMFNLMWMYFWIYYISLFLLLVSMNFLSSEMASWSLLSMSGLPPFLLFLAKAQVIMEFTSYVSTPLLLIFPLGGAIISLFFYLKYVYSLWLTHSNSYKVPTLMCILISSMMQGCLALML